MHKDVSAINRFFGLFSEYVSVMKAAFQGY